MRETRKNPQSGKMVLLFLFLFPLLVGAGAFALISTLDNKLSLYKPSRVDLVMDLIERSDAEALRLFLRGRPGAATYVSKYGYKMLNFAVSGEVAKLLIAYGADVNGINPGGSTPLHITLAGEHDRAAIQIILHGADIHARSHMGNTPLMTALGIFRSTESIEVVKLLVEKGARIDDTNKEGWTPLHFAAFSGDRKSVDFLLGRGADPEARDHRGRTPMDKALEEGRLEIARVLEERMGGARVVSFKEPAAGRSAWFSGG